MQVKAEGGSHDVYSQMTTNLKIPPLLAVCQKTARERWTERFKFEGDLVDVSSLQKEKPEDLSPRDLNSLLHKYTDGILLSAEPQRPK